MQTETELTPRQKFLAEYMEKFGKDLNEQERRTGDELWLWLAEKVDSLEMAAFLRGTQAEKKHLTSQLRKEIEGVRKGQLSWDGMYAQACDDVLNLPSLQETK